MAKQNKIETMPEADIASEAAVGAAGAKAKPEPKTDRKAIAKRLWVDGAGVEVEREESATGFTYVHLASGESFTWQSGLEAGSAAAMIAVFGGLTLAGNVVNTWNGSDPADRAASPVKAIEERFALLTSGTWIARGDGTRASGAKYDKDILAACIAELKGDGDVAAFREKLNDASYFSKVRTVPAVMDLYAERAPKAPGTTRTLEDI